MSKCLKFCTGIEILNRFSRIMSICRHELGGGSTAPAPGNSHTTWLRIRFDDVLIYSDDYDVVLSVNECAYMPISYAVLSSCIACVYAYLGLRKLMNIS